MEERSGSENPPFSRMVFMLVDAMRADFIFGNASMVKLFFCVFMKTQMTFTRSLIQEGKTFHYVAQADPPTVTLPRIKALTSGSIPNFVDVLVNLGASAISEDNWIHQLKKNGKKIVFYGDDTWIRLFPDSFMRFEGTTSFFVTVCLICVPTTQILQDTQSVDSNVTRNVLQELENSDWDVMILHYLGLDHIGFVISLIFLIFLGTCKDRIGFTSNCCFTNS